MTERDSITEFAVVVLLLILAVPALTTAHDYAGTPLAYEETHTVDYSDRTNVTQNATLEGYGGDPTIIVNGTTLVEDSDYRWDESDGSVRWINTSNTTEGSSARIEFRAYQRTAETKAAWLILTPFLGLFGVFGLYAGVKAMLNELGEAWQ